MSLFPTINTHGRPIDLGDSAGYWRQWLLFVWLLLLVGLPLFLHGIDGGMVLVPERLVDVRMHALIELFCGVTALLIAGLITALSHHNQEGSLRLFAMGFLVMGMLDILHAITPPDTYPNLFVTLHTLSILLGGVLFCLGAIRHYRMHRQQGSLGWASPQVMVALAALVVLVVAYDLIMPARQADGVVGFSAWEYRIHEFSGTLYAIAALLAFIFYFRTHQRLVLVVGAMLMLFAESAYLFRFSQMWDSAWWTWHLVKVNLYLGSLVVIATSLVLSLRAVQRAQVEQDRINRELRHAHDKLDEMNHELRVRNSMVNASIGASSLNQTMEVIDNTLTEFVGVCRYSLVLRFAEDEVEEFQRGLQRQDLRWDVQVRADQVPCVQLGEGEERPDYVVHRCERGSDANSCIGHSLRAQDELFGYLRMEVVGRKDLAPDKLDQLNVVAAEIGPILHNALLHYRWTQAIEFRAALLRVAGMLGSTLELPNVLEAVCAESAKMIDSEASGILLEKADGEGMEFVSRCMAGETGTTQETSLVDWVDSDEGRALLERLRVSHHPLTLVKPNSPDVELPFPLGTTGCIWGSVALFPMLDAGRLVAVMLIMRRERIPFSASALEQGELLAEQVRLALVNAKTYEALRLSNEQLRHSEQERLRGERLAVLGQMAASVAHEVRNPLGAINNCLAVLRKNIDTQHESLAPALEIIDDEVHRLDRLTHNFMSFGRTPRMEVARVHLAILVARVCERMERHIHHEGLTIAIEQDIKSGYEAARFDVDGFQEVLWNLMLNAVQATGNNGRVRVRLGQKGGHGFLAIQDDGPGIPAAWRTHIFDPFFTQRSEGAGLGLAIVQQHVERWGGRLRIWGPPGTCFALRFPVAGVDKADTGHAV